MNRIKLPFNYIKLIFLICSLFLSITVQAQAKKKKKKNTATERIPGCYTIMYGNKFLTNPFYKEFSNSQSFNLSQPIQEIGVGLNDLFFHFNPWYSLYEQINYRQFLPTTFEINDSISCRMSGFNFNFALGGSFIKSKSRFIMPIYLGFNTGRVTAKSGDLKKKNPFFSPMVSVQPGLRITKRICVGAIFNYEYDVSKTGWLNTQANSDNTSSLLNLNQSGYTLLVSLGYSIHR